MSVSVIINTCALQSADTPSSQGTPHKWREYALRNWILPAYMGNPLIDQIIVAGTWEEGLGYIYVPSPSKYLNCIDALSQRHDGFLRATGSTLIFQHDDHLFNMDSTWLDLTMANLSADVLVPERWTRLRNVAGEKLNNGEPDYISGHCAIYNRRVIETCPWSNVPKRHTWDMGHTKQIQEGGFEVTFTDVVKCWDTENGATPWA